MRVKLSASSAGISESSASELAAAVVVVGVVVVAAEKLNGVAFKLNAGRAVVEPKEKGFNCSVVEPNEKGLASVVEPNEKGLASLEPNEKGLASDVPKVKPGLDCSPSPAAFSFSSLDASVPDSASLVASGAFVSFGLAGAKPKENGFGVPSFWDSSAAAAAAAEPKVKGFDCS